MEPTADETPAKRRRMTQIPQETMLEVLLWLDRFDLDCKQITTRRLRSLVDNKQMPLRKVERVDYDGDERRYWNPPVENHTLSISLEEDEKREVEFRIETDVDAQKAAFYLASCFVRYFSIYGHLTALPKSAIIAAPALIHDLDFRNCNFNRGEEDTLSTTLGRSTFRSLSLSYSNNPAWQIDDKRLESLRLRGGNEIHVEGPASMDAYYDTARFNVTEEGILRYCFNLDGDLTMPERRCLRISWATITPEFFQKVVEASKNSHLTCDVELCLEHLRFGIGSFDVGVLPSRYQEYDRFADSYEHNVRYNIADHGDGIRLLIHFKSADGEEWEVLVRHGKKDHDEFFDPPQPDEEDAYSPSTEYLKHELELEDPDE